MKNKGFTLIEILAVIVILGIVASIAMISVSRYRSEANKRDLINLYSALETSYNNYRLSVLNKGDMPEDEIFIKNGKLYEDDGFINEKTDIDAKSVLRFFSDLAYSGDALASEKLEIIIVNRDKGKLIGNTNYEQHIQRRLQKKYGAELNTLNTELTSINSQLATKPNDTDLISQRNELYRKLDYFYIKETSCKITSAIVTGEETEVTAQGEEKKQIKTINKWCARTNDSVLNSRIPSSTELFCASIKSNNISLIDDFEKNKGLYHNNLCFTGGDDGYWSVKKINESEYS